MTRHGFEKLSPEEQAEVERNERIEVFIRWAFTGFCVIAVIAWLLWETRP